MDAARFWTDRPRHAPRKLFVTRVPRFGHTITVVDGFDGTTDVNALTRILKLRLHVGASATNGRIELQGDVVGPLRPLLRDLGFASDASSRIPSPLTHTHSPFEPLVVGGA